MGEQLRNEWTNGRASKNFVSQWEGSMNLTEQGVREQPFSFQK